MAEVRIRRRILVAAGIAVMVALAAGGYAIAAGPGAPQLRLATVGYADVNRTLSSTGVIQPMNTANLNFPVSGVVGQVLVSSGQRVSAGQRLAALDTSELTSQVASAQATVATDKAKLSADETSQTSTSTQVKPAAFSTALGSPQVELLADTRSTIQQAQQKLLGDQQKADTALATERTAVAEEKTACATTDASGISSACTAALAGVLADQDGVSTAQGAVSSDEAALNKALASAPTTPPKSTTQKQATPKPSRSTDQQSGGSAKKGPASAQQLSADQAAIDAANAQVTVAQQNLTQAQLVSPIAGTVGALSISSGQAVSAGSQTTPEIEVLGPGSDEVSVTVDDTQVGSLKVGDRADITADGTKTPLTGSVTSIGLLSTATSGPGTYPVTIGINGHPAGLFAGSGADVNIVLGSVSHVVAVPSSAVRDSTVTKLGNGKPATVRVGLGTVGAVYTQITSGLRPGDQVALANLAEPMPTSGSSSVRGLTGGRGGGGR